MRKFFKYLFRTLGVLVALILLLVGLLYVPAVQRYIKDRVVEYAASRWDMTVRIGELSLKFPVDLSLERVYAGKTDTDTLAYLGRLRLDAGIGRLMWGQIAVHDLQLEDVVLNLRNDTTGMVLKVRTDRVGLQADVVSLREKRVDISRLLCSGGNVFLTTGVNKEDQDTVKNASSFDWTFAIRQLEIDRVYYTMTSEALSRLYAGVGKGIIAGGVVDMVHRQVNVDSVNLSGGVCDLITTDTQDVSPARVAVVPDTAGLWTVEAGHLELENSAFSMSGTENKKFELTLTDIGLRIDSVYNRGTVVKADLSRLQVVRAQGGRIEKMQANIDMGEERTGLGNVSIRTPYSSIRLNALSDAPLAEIGKTKPLRVVLEASVGMEDVRLFWAQMPSGMVRKSVKFDMDISYRADRIGIRKFMAVMPGNFDLSGTGELASFRNLNNLAGVLNLEGNIQDVSFLNEKNKRFRIPDQMRLSLAARAEAGVLHPRLELCRGAGCVTVDGSYDIKNEGYDIRLASDRFDIGRFLPADSLGILTTDIKLTGHGYRFGKANARLTLDLRELVYKRHSYRDILLATDVQGSRINGLLKSGDPALLSEIAFKADSIGKRYAVDVNGKVEKVALQELHLVAEEFSVGMNFDIKASLGEQGEILLNTDIRQVKIDDASNSYDLGGLTLRLDSEPTETEADLVSGDFRLAFRSDTAVTEISAMLGNAVGEIQRQVRQRRLAMDSIQALLPYYTLTIEGSVDNVMGRYLQARGIRFKEVSLKSASQKGEGVNMEAVIVGPVLDKVKFDSVCISLHQWQNGMDYRVKVLNPQGIVKDLYDVMLYGSVQDNRFKLAALQKNKEGQVGVDFGAAFTFRDSSFAVNFFPHDPILGYTKWMVNAGNELNFYKGGEMTADLRMAYQEKLISLQSLEDHGDEKRRLQVEINGIDLASVSNMIPFVPDIQGILGTDLLFYTVDGHTIAEGDFNILNFYYQQQRIGDVNLDVNYSAANRFTDHSVDFTLYLDDKPRAVAKGDFSTSDRNRDITVDVDLPSLPLSVVNAFLPSDLLRLTGELQGKIDLRGTMDNMSVNGGIAFRDAKADITMLGTGFVLDTTYIPVKSGKILFEKFGFWAPNRHALTVDGSVTVMPLTRMGMDLTLAARDFQIVNVKANPESMVYGKAYTDLSASIRGPFDHLKLTGNVKLLNNTAINYVLRNSSPELKDRSVDLVRFVSFRDTTLLEKDLLTNRVNTGSFNMKVFIEIGDAVNVNVDLSEGGDNQIAIQGGGNLIFSITPEEGNNLSGKYTLAGGTVRYAIPVVGDKLFTIQSGSYVEWTGPVDNPAFHITASESVRVSVTEDNQSSRLVNFDAMILIQGNLQQPQITFDLAAPNDQAIQVQLAAFSPEERTKQAMNLLIYGTYSGPGTVNTGSTANNTLNNFVEKELNQWSRKYLKNAGLTFGIDTYNQIGAGGQETKRTDYSYQFSKQLFNDKVNVKIGGRISADNDPGSSMEDNLVDDIAIEYMFTKNRNWFLKVFRHTNYESVLEGEVTQTGVGIVLRKSFRKVKDLFIRKSKREAKK